MPEKKWLVIHLEANYIRKAFVVLNAEENLALQSEELCSIYEGIKLFTRKEQLEINDLMRDWLKDLEKQNKQEDEKIQVQLMASQDFYNTEGSKGILDSIKAQFGLETVLFSSVESARQSFMGLKKSLFGYRSNSRLAYISIEKNKTVLVFGDLYKQDKIIQIDLGVQQITDYIVSLKKNEQLESLPLFVKANLYHFIEQARFFGKPQLICFDENTTHLLLKTLASESKSQRVSTECIQQLCSKIIDSGFQYLNNLNWLSSEALNSNSAHLILASFIAEGLSATTCALDTECRFKGLIIDKLLDEDKLKEQFLGHVYDWKKSAQEILMRFNPISFSRSAQLALLAARVFDSGHGWLHNWGEKERKLIWLSGFFYTFLSQNTSGSEIIFNLQGISYLDSQLITAIINLTSLPDFTGQSKYLDPLLPEYRGLVRKLASMVQIAKALDITGRSAIQNISLEAKPRCPEKIILKIFPRLNPMPELIQVNILKKVFENQFEQKLEIELVPKE